MAGSKPAHRANEISKLLIPLTNRFPSTTLGSPSLSLGLSIEPSPAPMRSSEEPKGRASYSGAGSHYICPETGPVSAPFCAISVETMNLVITKMGRP